MAATSGETRSEFALRFNKGYIYWHIHFLLGHTVIRNYHTQQKTLGPRAAQLVTELYELRRVTFNIADVEAITGLSAGSARTLVHKARQRGLVTRLKPGLYNLVPFELGRATDHVDSPYVIARELAGAAPYFISHGTAFELHRMVTQPNLTINVSCTRRVRPQRVGGYDFRFIHITAAQQFGVVKHWIDKERFVMISDMERTNIDGLRHPAFAGGITEVAKGLWIKRDALKPERLVDYALRLDGCGAQAAGLPAEHYHGPMHPRWNCCAPG